MCPDPLIAGHIILMVINQLSYDFVIVLFAVYVKTSFRRSCADKFKFLLNLQLMTMFHYKFL